MTVTLTAVAFDHQFQAGLRYSVPLRFNEFQRVSVPEWVRGNPMPSVAAYVRKRLPRTALVLARFTSFPRFSNLIEIRATAESTIEAVIPDLPPTLVSFAAGDSGWCTFPLDTSMLVTQGVSQVSFQWTWQFRAGPSAPWDTFDQSVHKIYLLLSKPTEPWSDLHSPFNSAAPWVEVLDIACEWANGAHDAIEAATMITKAVNDLGGRTLTYDAYVGGPHYTVLGVPRFLCEAFIDRLRGGPGAGPLVNCSDCATIVSTFANILGCDLWQSKMGLVAPLFSLNPILGIGLNTFSTLQGGFGFHEVAWTGDCGELDTVYDACLQTDSDGDPTTEPHVAALPVNQVFGRPGSGDYRDQIAAPADREVCVPQPGLRIRRSLLSQTTPFAVPSPGAITRNTEARLGVTGSSPLIKETDYFFEGFKFFGTEFPGWALTHVEQFSSSALQTPSALSGAAPFVRPSKVQTIPRVIVSWWQSGKNDDSFLRIESFDAASSTDAQALLLRVAGEVETPLLRRSDDEVGDVVFTTPDKVFVLFARGNHVHAVRHVAIEPEAAIEQAQYLDDWLTGAGQPATAVPLTQPENVPMVADTTNTWKRLVLHRTQAKRTDRSLLLQPRTGVGATVSEEIVGPGHAPPRNREAQRNT